MKKGRLAMKSVCLARLVLLLLSAMLVFPAQANSEFPNRTVKILVGFAPGGTTDLLARIVADELRSIWNAAVVVENRPGADGIVATTAMHNAPADGYTLLMSTNALVITPHLKQLPYDPIKDFEPITIVGQEYHHMLVTPGLPAKTVKEFIALAKSTPGGLTFSSAGPGSAPFLGMQRFIQASGIANMVHVPYPGSMPAAMALVTSDVQSMFSSPSTTVPLSSEGKIRVLAVAGPKRDPNVPDVPTLAESGLPGFESNTWFALMASSKVPPDVLEKIRTDVAKAMRSPVVLKRINDIKSIPVGNTPDEFRKIVLSDFEIFGRVIANAK
jgi:tripartite-type tricarboxylate transporter receptor subunit TctC